jgi:hypothetical protein
VLFYDSSTGKLQRSVPVPAVPLYVDFPHQRFAASTATDVILYDLQSAAEQLRLRGHGGIDRHALSPDGKRLVLVRWPRTLDGESEVSFWSLETGKRVLTLSRKSSVVDLAFSADGYKLFSVTGAGRGGKPIEVWDATPLPTP